MVFPKQIIGSSPWLGSLWETIGVLHDKPILIVWGMKDIAFRETKCGNGRRHSRLRTP